MIFTKMSMGSLDFDILFKFSAIFKTHKAEKTKEEIKIKKDNV